MLAAGNEYFVAGQPISPGFIYPRLCAQQPHIATGLGFGQAHGGQALTADDFAKPGLAKLGRAKLTQAFVGAMGNAAVHGPAMVAGVDHFVQRSAEQQRQALPAVRLRAGQAWPAAVHITLVSLAKPGWRAHMAVLEPAAFAITGPVQRH
ncbi:hypothetical protein D3C79_816530 [compost metagenome]